MTSRSILAALLRNGKSSVVGPVASRPPASSARLVLYLALGGDLLIAAIKFAGAMLTGSSALFSEGIHSTVDALSEVLLLYGLTVSRRPSTIKHQLGFGREVFFWNLIVALAILALGAGAALLDGIRQIVDPSPLAAPLISYGVLAIGLLAEIPGLVGAIRNVNAKRGRSSWARYVRISRDPTAITVLFGSVSGVLGLLVAAGGTFLSTALRSMAWDGVASVLIAVMLGATALFLAANSKALLIGVPASPSTVSSILKLAASHPAVEQANGAITVHLAPDQILVAMSVTFRPSLSTLEIQDAVAAIDTAERAAHPAIFIFLLKPQSVDQYAAFCSGQGW